MKILIADDDPSTRVMLRTLVTKFGHTVVECESGSGALNEFESDAPPRLALIDWLMPEPDGLEVVRRIREEEMVSAYLILLTQRQNSEDKVEGLEAGADDYIVKPIEPGELCARIQAGIRILDMQDRLDRKVKELTTALGQIRTLSGILPICSHCKKICDDKGYWKQVEIYVSDHSDADFTHSICPECMSIYYPGMSRDP